MQDQLQYTQVLVFECSKENKSINASSFQNLRRIFSSGNVNGKRSDSFTTSTSSAKKPEQNQKTKTKFNIQVNAIYEPGSNWTNRYGGITYEC